MTARLAVCSALVVMTATAQNPTFEVASVKPSTSDRPQSNIQRDPAGGIVLNGVNLRTLVLMAYNLQPFQLEGGPSWLRSRWFDVAGKAPAGAVKSQTWAMLQTLLADRFQLLVHRETRELPIFELVAAKGGLKIEPAHRAPSVADDSIVTNPGRWKGMMVKMSGLALSLSGLLGHQVVDRTDIDGRYDFQLEFAPDDAAAPDRPSLYTALQEQLGLKLNTSKGPVEIIVIDHAELPTAN